MPSSFSSFVGDSKVALLLPPEGSIVQPAGGMMENCGPTKVSPSFSILTSKGGLADKPFEVKIEKEGDTLVGPQFSIIPPAGWTIEPSGGNNKATFESPTKDEKEEGIAYFYLLPNINVHITQALGKSVDDTLPSSKNNFAASG